MSLILMSPQIVFATEYIVCGDDKHIPKVIGDLFSALMVVVKIIVPILLVVSGMISFLKVVYSGNTDDDMKKAQKKLINNIIAAVVIFLVVSIISFVVGLTAGKNNSAMSCVRCLVKPEGCEIIDSKDDLCPGLIGQEYDENCGVINDPYQKEKEEDINKDNYINSNTTNPSSTPSATPVIPTTPIDQVQTCCPQGGGTYNNGTCENITNQSAYDACLNSGTVDVPEENNESENITPETESKYNNCCVQGGGKYNNGTCESITNQAAYDACINTSLSNNNDAINVLRESCCLRANGYFKDNVCKKYEVNENAYSACVGTSKKKTVLKDCCDKAGGKFENAKCISSKFDEDLYEKCK